MDEIILKQEFQHLKFFTVGMHSDIFKLRQKIPTNMWTRTRIQIAESCTENRICNNLVNHNEFTS